MNNEQGENVEILERISHDKSEIEFDFAMCHGWCFYCGY